MASITGTVNRIRYKRCEPWRLKRMQATNVQTQRRTRRKIKEEGIVFHTGSHCNGAPDVACTWQRRYTMIHARRQSCARDSTGGPAGVAQGKPSRQLGQLEFTCRGTSAQPFTWYRRRAAPYSLYTAKRTTLFGLENKISHRRAEIRVTSCTMETSTRVSYHVRCQWEALAQSFPVNKIFSFSDKGKSSTQKFNESWKSVTLTIHREYLGM
jgi:hypothetical protein